MPVGGEPAPLLAVVIHPRCASLSNSVRAAMSFHCPVAVRQSHSTHSSCDKR